jgi:hypothetical protein
MEVLEKTAHEEAPHPKEEPKGEPVPNFEQALSNLSNPELLSALDLAFLELEKRLFRYAKVGPELLEMADEGAHRGTPAGGGGRRVASYRHAPLLERRAAPARF